jgi:hypothetical protein
MPCNDMVMFRLRDNGDLDMTVCNRSNDAIWGVYGANVVQFSVLQEFVAGSLGANVGKYVQMSNSFHVYTDDTHSPFWAAYSRGEHAPGHVHNLYMTPDVQAWPLMTDMVEAEWVLKDCEMLEAEAYRVHDGKDPYDSMAKVQFNSTYFQALVRPMLIGYGLYKRKDYMGAVDALKLVAASDWSVAMMEWVYRRHTKAQAA